MSQHHSAVLSSFQNSAFICVNKASMCVHPSSRLTCIIKGFSRVDRFSLFGETILLIRKRSPVLPEGHYPRMVKLLVWIVNLQ